MFLRICRHLFAQTKSFPLLLLCLFCSVYVHPVSRFSAFPAKHTERKECTLWFATWIRHTYIVEMIHLSIYIFRTKRKQISLRLFVTAVHQFATRFATLCHSHCAATQRAKKCVCVCVWDAAAGKTLCTEKRWMAKQLKRLFDVCNSEQQKHKDTHTHT